MHPLITAIINRAKLREIEPRGWGMYYPMWYGFWCENEDLIRELSKSVC